MRLASTITLGLLASIAAPSLAHAADYTVCLRIPVTITDATGQEGDIGGNGNWIARGIRIETLRRNGISLSGFSGTFADADSGCFSFSAPTSSAQQEFTIGIRSYGRLGGNNELRVHNDSGVTSYYTNTVTLPGSGGTFVVVWDKEYILPRMYAILAYSINNGYRGRYGHEVLRVWWHADRNTAGSSPCGCDDSPPWGACTCRVDSTDQGHITLPDGQSARKFVLAHEYGHRVLGDGIVGTSSNCSYNGSGHHMRSAEWSSCAAMEGWANFVSADIWNGHLGIHSGGDPTAWLRYWGFGNPVIDVEAGQGTCATSGGDTAVNYPVSYADDCLSQAGFAFESRCSGGDCDALGTELDWMRMWWDYHTDGDLPGTLPDHADLQDDIEAAGGWTRESAWHDILAGISALNSTQGNRFWGASNGNGVTEP